VVAKISTTADGVFLAGADALSTPSFTQQTRPEKEKRSDRGAESISSGAGTVAE